MQWYLLTSWGPEREAHKERIFKFLGEIKEFAWVEKGPELL
jgi:hypothetical protein